MAAATETARAPGRRMCIARLSFLPGLVRLPVRRPPGRVNCKLLTIGSTPTLPRPESECNAVHDRAPREPDALAARLRPPPRGDHLRPPRTGRGAHGGGAVRAARRQPRADPGGAREARGRGA